MARRCIRKLGLVAPMALSCSILLRISVLSLLGGLCTFPSQAQDDQGSLPLSVRAFRHMLAQNWGQAIQDYETLVAIQPDNVRASYYLGLIYNGAGQLDKALERWNHIETLDMLPAARNIQKAHTLARMGDMPAALRSLQKAADAGYFHTARLAQNPAFESLDANPVFDAIQEQTRSNASQFTGLPETNAMVLDHTEHMHPLWTTRFPAYDLTSITSVDVPSDYDPDQAYGLIYWIPDVPDETRVLQSWSTYQDAQRKRHEGLAFWRDILDQMGERNWIIASPSMVNASGQDFSDWGWLSGEGFIVFEEVLAEIKNHYSIDDKRIVLSGFRMGADLVWHQAQAHPDWFLGIVPISGHPGQIDRIFLNNHLVNLRNASLYALNGQQDESQHPAGYAWAVDRDITLQPSAAYIAPVQAEVSNAEWRVIAASGQRLSDFEPEQAAIATWLKAQAYTQFPTHIEWQAGLAYPSYRDVHWLRIDEIYPTPIDHTFPALDSSTQPPATITGFWHFRPHTEGIDVIRSFDGSPFAQAGLRRGDLVKTINGEAITDTTNMNRLDEILRSGPQPSTIEFERGGYKHVAQVYVKKTLTSLFFAPPEYARIQLIAEGNTINVRSDNVGAFTLSISPHLFDITEPIRVMVNGVEQYNTHVAPEAYDPLGEIAMGHNEVAGVVRIRLERNQ